MRILFNARIWAPHIQKPATALAIENGRIIGVGSDDEIIGLQPERTHQRNMAGKTIWPGLVDAHMHLQMYAFHLQRVDCETPTQQTCLDRILERGRTTSTGEWIIGHGWNQNIWAEEYGTAAQLDAVSRGHPVYLTSKSVHSAWVNTAALSLAGITKDTCDPSGGVIQRHDNGNPTGILFETAMELVARCIPPPLPSEVVRVISEAQSSLWKMGITGLHDFDGADCFNALQTLNQEGRLKLRIVKGIPAGVLDHALGAGLRGGFGSDMLRIGPLKLFADGALGPQTAAILTPFNGSNTNQGILMLEQDEILAYARKAIPAGFSLAVHAIGDRANREALNAYEKIRQYEKTSGYPHLRHRIEHVQLIQPDDAARLADLGIIASMQPIHAPSDMLMADKFWGERSRYAYAWRTLQLAGAALAFGSDAPVESPNPFWGLHAAITRQRSDNTPQGGWYPAQRLTLHSALHAFTQGAAYAGNIEHQTGQLAEGYQADLIVLDEDPFTLPAELVCHIHPLATMVGGEWVWESGSYGC